MTTTTQTWNIRGQVYTHAQLMEMKKQGIDPRKDNVVLKFVTPLKDGSVRSPVEEKHTLTEEDLKNNPDLQGVVEAGDEVTLNSDLNNFNMGQLKKLAKVNGMVTTNTTKKVEIVAFLESLDEIKDGVGEETAEVPETQSEEVVKAEVQEAEEPVTPQE